MQTDQQWLTRFIDRCQRLAGQSLSADPAAVLRELRALADEAPDSVPPPERIVVRGLIAKLAARIEREAPSLCRPFTRALLTVAPSVVPDHTFRDELTSIIDR